jgi:hypothetical protein
MKNVKLEEEICAQYTVPIAREIPSNLFQCKFPKVIFLTSLRKGTKKSEDQSKSRPFDLQITGPVL